MSAAAALKKKPAESGEKAAKSARPEADPTASASGGMPAYLGGIAGGSGSPVFLQRAPIDSTPPIAEEEPLPDGSIQRLPQDPFPSAEEEETEDQAGTSIQAKLEINTPGDGFEQEADRVADAVTSGGASAPVTSSGGTPEVQRKCDSCGKKQPSGGTCPDCAAKVQRKESGSAAPKPTSNVAQAVSRPGSGAPIPERTRAPIEAELGQDLSHVRVHQGSEAAEAASSIGAKAFTHSNHIWLGPGQSADDTALMAHEATHTVQQGSGGSGPALVQRAPADHQHPEDGQAPLARMNAEIENSDEDGGDWEQGDPIPKIDQSKRRATAGPLVGKARPDTDRPAQEGPKVEQAANEVKQEVDSPAEKLVDGQADKPDAEAAATDEAPAVADPVSEAAAQIASLPEPEAPEQIEAPPIAQPVDGDGQPLPLDEEGEVMVQVAASQLQMLRDAAYGMRRKAKEQRANAIALRGNLALADRHIGEAEAGLSTAHGHMEVRRSVISEADNAYAVSEVKAETVAQEAPGFQAEAEDTGDESGPMASEASDSSAQAKANAPDDEEGAEKAVETGGQMNSVASDSASMDQAVSASRQKAIDLQADAAQAKEGNAEGKAKVEEATASADQTDTKLAEMDGQAAQARGELEPLNQTPDAAEAEAQRLDEEADATDQRVGAMANQLKSAQKQYISDMRSVPGSESLADQNQGQIQRTPDPANPASPCSGGNDGAGTPAKPTPPELQSGYEGRRKYTLPTFKMGPPLTEEQCKQQQEEAAKAKAKRQARIQSIQDDTHGDFEKMDGSAKLGLALDFMLEDAFEAASQVKWPDFSSGGIGSALLNLIDPRGPLNGIMGGLSKIASGGLNLFDLDQWSRDPVGNLLKSAADIATGITTILASILGLLGIVTAISAAIAVLTFWIPPVAAAAVSVMTWSAGAAITVGGWTVTAGLIAAGLHALALMKNIYDLATAKTANDFVQNTEQLKEDFSQVAEAGMQVASASVGGKGGAGSVGGKGSAGMLDNIAKKGVMNVAKREVKDNLNGAVIEAIIGEEAAGYYNQAMMLKGAVGKSEKTIVLSEAAKGGDGSSPAARGGEVKSGASKENAGTKLDSGSPDPTTTKASGGSAEGSAKDAETPNGQIKPKNGDAPDLVEGPVPKPNQDLDASFPKPAQSKADPTKKGDASAKGGVKGGETGDEKPKNSGSGKENGSAKTKSDAPSKQPKANTEAPKKKPKIDSDAEKSAKPKGDEADASGAKKTKADQDAETAALLKSASGKKADDMSPAELKAEANVANAGPKQDIGDGPLRDKNFDSETAIGNDKKYIFDSGNGFACRVSNTKCGKTKGKKKVPEEGLKGDKKKEAEVDAALTKGGDGPKKKVDEAESETSKPTQNADANVNRPKTAEEKQAIADEIMALRDKEIDKTTATRLEKLGYTLGKDPQGKVTSIRMVGPKAEGLPKVEMSDGKVVGAEGGKILRIEGADPTIKYADDGEHMIPNKEGVFRPVSSMADPDGTKLPEGKVDDGRRHNPEVGRWGETIGDGYALEKKGWIKISGDRTTMDSPFKGPNTLDAVYINPNPPPGPIIVADAKALGSGQSKTKNSGLQMSNKWIQKRRGNSGLSSEHQAMIEGGDFDPVILHVDKYGKVTESWLDNDGNPKTD